MTKSNLTLIVVLVAVIVALILTRSCGDVNVQPDRTEYIYDSIERVIKSKLPNPDTIYLKGETVIRWLPGATIQDTIYLEGKETPVYLVGAIDTAAILSHYLTQAVTYIDTIRDSALQAIITDTIFRNQNVGRGFRYKIHAPIITNIYNPDKFQLIASFQSGVGVSYANVPNGFFVGADLGLKFKSGTYFSIGYMAGSSHFVTLRAGQVIRLRKRRK